MQKLRRVCFYFILFGSRPRDFWRWMLTVRLARRRAGGIVTGANGRAQLSDWAMNELFARPMDFGEVMRILAGDAYYQQNIDDAARLHAETGKLVTELWDTDPIFARYPRLRTLARNAEFEKMWAKKKGKER